MRIRHGINFKLHISYVVWKGLSILTEHTKACAGLYIRNGKAWESYGLSIEQSQKLLLRSSLLVAALNVRVSQQVNIFLIVTYTNSYRTLRHDNKIHWHSAPLCIDRVQCYQLTWLCYVRHGASLRCCIAADLLGARPATESCAARAVQPTPARFSVTRI